MLKNWSENKLVLKSINKKSESSRFIRHYGYFLKLAWGRLNPLPLSHFCLSPPFDPCSLQGCPRRSGGCGKHTLKFFVARLDVILVLFALKNVKRIPSRPVFIVEVELVFSHHEAAEKDQGGLQEKHQVWLRIETKDWSSFCHLVILVRYEWSSKYLR